MINGIPYPICPDLKKIIEDKRKEFAEMQGLNPRKVSQAKFTKLLCPIVKCGKINVRPKIYKNAKKKLNYK